jgi:hypothetical protein
MKFADLGVRSISWVEAESNAPCDHPTRLAVLFIRTEQPFSTMYKNYLVSCTSCRPQMVKESFYMTKHTHFVRFHTTKVRIVFNLTNFFGVFLE